MVSGTNKALILSAIMLNVVMPSAAAPVILTTAKICQLWHIYSN
jgi:hypothetical protein